MSCFDDLYYGRKDGVRIAKLFECSRRDEHFDLHQPQDAASHPLRHRATWYKWQDLSLYTFELLRIYRSLG